MMETLFQGSFEAIACSPSPKVMPIGWSSGMGSEWCAHATSDSVSSSRPSLRERVSWPRIRPHPEEAARAADSELRRYHQEHPGHRSHVLTSAWHVPVRWFTAFQPEDKEVYEVEGSPRIRLRADLAVGRKGWPCPRGAPGPPGLPGSRRGARPAFGMDRQFSR